MCVWGGGGHVRENSADLPIEQRCPQAHFRTCEFWSVSWGLVAQECLQTQFKACEFLVRVSLWMVGGGSCVRAFLLTSQ